MKRILFAAAPLAVAVWALVESGAPPASLAGYVPPSPLLVLEARDFHTLVADWNASREKQAWLGSDNFQVFSRSRLYLRLGDARNEFAAAAGVPPGMDLVESVAGTQSALALYDIGNLHFLYITRLPSARALETALWQSRSSYETRNAAGLPYFLRTDPASHRVVAFAAANDCLLLATREDLMAGALTLLAGKPGLAVTGEHWYSESVRAAAGAGDLRLVMNLAALVRSPHFRSYWIQRNVSQLRQFSTAISYLNRTPGGLREERVLLRADSSGSKAEPAPGLSAGTQPDGLSRLWARPTAAEALELIRGKVFAPGPAAPPPSEVAPEVFESGPVGSDFDLETRIDEPPLVMPVSGAVPEAVRSLIEVAPLEAMLSVSSSRAAPGGVFVDVDTAVVLLAAKPWDVAAVKAAFASGPLDRRAAEARDRILVVSSSAAMAKRLAAAAQPDNATAVPGVTYAAAFNHAAERPRFLKMMRLIDSVSSPVAEGGSREPAFFSGNVGSLSGTLARIGSVSMTARDTGGSVFETVTYGFVK